MQKWERYKLKSLQANSFLELSDRQWKNKYNKYIARKLKYSVGMEIQDKAFRASLGYY